MGPGRSGGPAGSTRTLLAFFYAEAAGERFAAAERARADADEEEFGRRPGDARGQGERAALAGVAIGAAGEAGFLVEGDFDAAAERGGESGQGGSSSARTAWSKP